MKAKILIIGPSDTQSKGGMATVISEIRNSRFLNEKYHIDVFSSYIDGNLVTRILYSVYRYFCFLKIYKEYDLFHIHTASNGSTFRKRLYMKAIKKAGKKAILHIHGAGYLVFYNGLNKRKKNIVVNFLKSADTVIGLSDGWKNEFERTFGLSSCKSLPNGIDTDSFSASRCDLQQHKNEFILLGRLGERKGVYDLISAVELAVLQNPDIKVYLAGDGEIERCRELVRQKGLTDNIEVVGWVDSENKIKFLKKCATLVLPSYHEGLPMSILEGMAAGKAVISTTVGAIPEVIGEENGILIAPGDVKSLADALLKCSSDTDFLLTVSENNIKKVNDKFSIGTMHETLSRYYDSVLKSEPKRR